MAIVGGQIQFTTALDMSGIKSAASKVAAIFAGIKVMQEAYDSINVFVNGMSKVVPLARQYGVSLATAEKALKLSEISGIRLEEAIRSVNDASAANTEEEIKSVELMTRWKILASDIQDIYKAVGKELLTAIAPAFPNIVQSAQNLGNTIRTYVIPTIGMMANAVSNIGKLLGASADLGQASFEVAILYIRKAWDDGIAWISGSWNTAADSVYEVFAGAFNKLRGVFEDTFKFILQKINDIQLAATEAIMDPEAREREQSRLYNERGKIDAMGSQRFEAENRAAADQRFAARQSRAALAAADQQQRNDAFNEAVRGPAERINQASKEINESLSTPAENKDDRAGRYARAALGGGGGGEEPPATNPIAEPISKGSVFGTFSGMTAGQMGGGSMQENAQRQTGLLERISAGIMDVFKAVSGSLGAINTSAPRVDRGT